MPEIDSESFDRHYPLLAYEVGLLMMAHLRRLYREFDGDLTMCIVLGEIAHYNARYFMRELLPRSGTDAKSLATDAVLDEVVRRCNALSIAEASGIPRETVRRKLDKLERIGWIARDGKGGIRVTRAVGRHFRNIDRAVIADVLETADRLRSTLRAD